MSYHTLQRYWISNERIPNVFYNQLCSNAHHVQMHITLNQTAHYDPRHNTANIGLVDGSHMNYAMNPAALFSAQRHYNVQAFFEVGPQLIRVSHSGIIMMHGLNECHITPYRDWFSNERKPNIFHNQLITVKGTLCFNALYITSKCTLWFTLKCTLPQKKVRYTTNSLRLFDSSHMNNAMNPAAFFAAPRHYNFQAFFEVGPQLIQVSHSGFIMMHGLNECHITPYRDIEFQMKEYQMYFIINYVQMHIMFKCTLHCIKLHIMTHVIILLTSDWLIVVTGIMLWILQHFFQLNVTIMFKLSLR